MRAPGKETLNFLALLTFHIFEFPKATSKQRTSGVEDGSSGIHRNIKWLRSLCGTLKVHATITMQKVRQKSEELGSKKN
jgi:hypothetical protein